MRAENRLVPFPEGEIKNGNGELERYFLSLFDKDLFDYNNLPPTISSVGMDQYATWLSNLTQEDPEHRERAAFIYLRRDTEQFIYPPNPSLGTQARSIPVFTLNPGKFIPAVRVHSHPDSTCFSPQDLKRGMIDDGIWSRSNEFVAELVGTTRFNYLLLRTSQTTFDDTGVVERKVAASNEAVADFIKQFQILVADHVTVALPEGSVEPTLRNAIVKRIVDTIVKLESEVFGSDFERYFMTLVTTHAVAKAYSLGFYYSDKKGVYRSFPETYLEEILEQRKTLTERGYNQVIVTLINRGTNDKTVV